MNPIETIYINNVATAVEVINGIFKFPYNIGQELTAIRFVGSNANNTITSINLKKADLFASVSHLDYCFMNCTALTEIDFGKKAFKTTLTATDTFKGCEALTTIKIDATSEWPANVNLADCPLTTASVYQFVNALKTYTSGLHTITLSDLTWQALTTAQKAELEGICEEKYWSIGPMYHIRGTVNSDSITLKINNTNTTIPVVDGEFDYQYVAPLTSLKNFAQGNATLTSVDFSDADKFDWLTSANYMFNLCSSIVDVDFSNQTFKRCEGVVYMFESCDVLENIIWSNDVNFDSLIDIGYGADTSAGWFSNCPLLTDESIAFLGSQTFRNVNNAKCLVSNCSSITEIDLHSATFENCTYAGSPSYTGGLIRGCDNLLSINLHNATFANCINAKNFINRNPLLQSIDLTSATFDKLEDASGMFFNNPALASISIPATFNKVTDMGSGYTRYGMFRACTHLVTINFPNATFDVCTNFADAFTACSALTTINIPASESVISSISLSDSPLTYQSIKNVANWLANLVGQTTQTIKFKATAWNSLSSAQQTEIDTIISGKNWSRT